MLRKFAFVVFFFIVSLNAFAYIEDEDFFTLKRNMRGVKVVTEKNFSKWKTVSFFRDDGFMLQKINYYKNEMRADYRYEYSMSDTLLEIKEKDYRNINNNKEGYTVRKYYYNHLKQCYRYEIYSSLESLEKPFVIGDNFIYKDGRLQSYERRYPNWSEIEIDKIIYHYDGDQQTIQKYYVTKDSVSVVDAKTLLIYLNNKLVDYIVESSNEGDIFTGVVCWSDKKMNKMHIRYSDFDKYENWTESYFITQKGKVFRSKRKIEYW